MNISGVLVYARPEQVEAVTTQLVKIPGVEVHASSPQGRLVLTIEAAHAGQMADTLVACQNVANVLSAAMIYHHDEELDEDETVSVDINLSDLDSQAGDDRKLQETSK
ncbi:MAG TPA: glutamate synthase [Gammaproteobacteria bacterium]|nr:glutamate synthase [Gammaproteobacteria bacterium]